MTCIDEEASKKRVLFFSTVPLFASRQPNRKTWRKPKKKTNKQNKQSAIDTFLGFDRQRTTFHVPFSLSWSHVKDDTVNISEPHTHTHTRTRRPNNEEKKRLGRRINLIARPIGKLVHGRPFRNTCRLLYRRQNVPDRLCGTCRGTL